MITDDMLSLRKFYHILEFTSQLKQQESKKNWRKIKDWKRVTIWWAWHDFSGRMQCFQVKENVSRLLKR